jgi:hypothetical protein
VTSSFFGFGASSSDLSISELRSASASVASLLSKPASSSSTTDTSSRLSGLGDDAKNKILFSLI